MQWIVICFLGLIGGLSIPLSNWFSERPFLEIVPQQQTNTAFVAFSKQFQVSCMDCHTPGQTQYPFYYPLPIVKTLMDQDIEGAQQAFSIDVQKLTGQIAFSAKDLRKIRKEIRTDRMPPLQYKLVHLESSLDASAKTAILTYIEQALQEVTLPALVVTN